MEPKLSAHTGVFGRSFSSTKIPGTFYRVFTSVSKPAPMPPGKPGNTRKTQPPPARPSPMMSSSNHLAQAKSTMNTVNQVNSGMQQMGIKPSHVASAANTLAPMIPTRPGGASRSAPMVPKRPPTQKPPTIPNRPNM